MKNSTLHLIKEFNGVQIRFMDGEKVNLTELWKASGAERHNRPVNWLALPGTQKFADTVAKNLKVEKSDLLETTAGRAGGTWAHKQIGLAYAKYLSPELHMLVNEVFFERLEEDADPELGYNRGKFR